MMMRVQKKKNSSKYDVTSGGCSLYECGGATYQIDLLCTTAKVLVQCYDTTKTNYLFKERKTTKVTFKFSMTSFLTLTR